MDEALIALDHVGKRFRNGVAALADLSLTVRAGDFLTLLGPSGCGKSTALRLMAGTRKADSGKNHQPSAAQGRLDRLRVSRADPDALGAGC